MDSGTKAKNITLIVSAVTLILSVLPISYSALGICVGCEWWSRVLYSFLHVNLIHCALNVWCILSVVFIYNISPLRLLLAYLCACSFPVDTLGAFYPSLQMPTVGLSGVAFALMGSISLEVKRVYYYQAWMVFYLIVGMLLPSVNGWVHAYCYICGLIYSVVMYEHREYHKRKRQTAGTDK